MDGIAASAAAAPSRAAATNSEIPARSLLSGNHQPPKRRKVTTAREEVSVHYAIGPTEDDAVIRQRLLTRTTTTRGEPPLKKLLKKFVAFASDVEKDTDNYGDCEKLYKSFLQELSTFELPLLKTKVVIDANRREQECFKELQAELSQQILQVQAEIEDLKVQLEESKVERQHKEECEVIRRLIGAQPPRAETQKILDELGNELSSLESDNMAASRTLDLRKKQFALLLHVVDDLQSTIEEELKNPVDESKVLLEDQKIVAAEKLTTEQEVGAVKVLMDTNDSAEPMQIEQT